MNCSYHVITSSLLWPHTRTICYVQDKMAFDMHLILCTWDVVTTCIPVTVFFPLGVQLCAKEEEEKKRASPWP